VNPARLALRTVLRGRPRAWPTVLAVTIVMCALALGAGPAPMLALVACVMGARTSLQTLARRRELATLRALGMPKPSLVLMLELEALWISASGMLLGLGAGSALAWFADRGAGASIPCFWMAGAVPAAGLLAALVPAIRAARHDVALGLALIAACQEG
jgi:hypothetical protein